MYGSNFVWWWFFFFKQKTAYEMRISDWSSDVCSSDLASRVRETLVDAVVPALEIAGIFGQVDAEMEQRPERLVGIAVIIFVDVLLLQINLFVFNFFCRFRFNVSASRSRGFNNRVRFNLSRFWWGLCRSEEHTSELQSLMRISYAVFGYKKNITK